MKKLCMILSVALAGACAAGALFGQNTMIVAPLENQRNIVDSGDMETLTRLFEDQIRQTRRFNLIDRGRLEQVIKERQFLASDWSDTKKIAQMSKVFNANYLAWGSVYNIGSTLFLVARIFDINTLEILNENDMEISMAEASSKMAAFVRDLTSSVPSAAAPPAASKPAAQAPAPPAAVPKPAAVPAAIAANMATLPAGTFTMGSPANEPRRSDNETQHQITVSGFYINKYEVTQEEYEVIMGNNPSHYKDERFPVENVSWFDAVTFCNTLSGMAGLTPAYTVSGNTVTWNAEANGYRLPTEAEWEYACRAGTTTPFNTGNNITTAQANYNGNFPYNGNAEGVFRQTTTAVGSFAANVWGLYDTHGNVWEWCWDRYGEYAEGPQTDPRGPSSGSGRVKRGGSWRNFAQDLRSAYRGLDVPSARGSNLGIRLARSF